MFTRACFILIGASAATSLAAAETQEQLQTQARVSESAARAIALAQVPHAIVRSAELERENKHLVWSYDLQTPGSKGVTEVQVDAITGKVVATHVESAQDEAKEAAADRK